MTYTHPPAGCCWHEHERHTQTVGDTGSMIKVERCCWCPEMRTLHFIRSPRSGHGPFASAVWTLVPLP